MQTPNNPASRLLEIIKKGQGIGNDVQAIDAWGEIFDTPRENLPLLLKRISSFCALPDEIEREIKEIEEANTPLYLDWRSKANVAFTNLNFVNNWNTTFKARFDDKAVYGIKFCDDLLSRQRPERTVATEDIDNLSNKVEELLNLIEEENIDQTTKNYIKERLIDIQQALGDIPILGTKVIEKEFQAVVGSLTINNTYNLQSEGSEFKTKFWRIIYGLGLLATATLGPMQIGEKVINALPESYQAPVMELVVKETP